MKRMISRYKLFGRNFASFLPSFLPSFLTIRNWFLVVLLLGMVAGTLAADGAVIYVNLKAAGNGSGVDWANACKTITAALTASTSGDEIWVTAGRYKESITLKEGVAIYGGYIGTEALRNARDWTANVTIIDAQGLNQSTIFGANNAVMDGFTITGGGQDGSYGGGLYCSNSSPALSHCIITGNTAGFGGGIYCSNSSPLLSHCNIEKNLASYGGGMYCASSSSLEMSDCSITENALFSPDYTTGSGGGLYFDYSSPKLTNCTISKNTSGRKGGGIYSNHSSPTLTNCVIQENTLTASDSDGGGLYCEEYSAPNLTNCCNHLVV